jgi:hypothetical protein
MLSLPPLPYHEWRDTRDTLHRWLQIVGKVRLAATPLVNHWWNVPLYVSARGLTTSSMVVDDRRIELELDFMDHVMRIRTQDAGPHYVELAPRTVADFYAATMTALRASGFDLDVWTTPVEIDDRTPFEHDREHRSYDRLYATRFWQSLSRIDDVLTTFRARFVGKNSPIHVFWGSMDLACTRFSGRRNPPFPGNRIDREAYSHEVSSVGWWPGDARLERPSFYSYAVPEPPGFASSTIAVPGVYYNPTLKGFYLDHDSVRDSVDPERTLLAFCGSTYAAAANLGAWPRGELERTPSNSEEDHGDLPPSGDSRQRSGANQRL